MAKINEVSFENGAITFNCEKKELEGLSISGNFVFFDANTLIKSNSKLVRRGRDESTVYLLLDKIVKEFVLKKYKSFFKDKNNTSIDSNVFEVGNDKYLVVKL